MKFLIPNLSHQSLTNVTLIDPMSLGMLLGSSMLKTQQFV